MLRTTALNHLPAARLSASDIWGIGGRFRFRWFAFGASFSTGEESEDKLEMWVEFFFFDHFETNQLLQI